jgi:hypothetical protein
MGFDPFGGVTEQRAVRERAGIEPAILPNSEGIFL